MRFPGGVGEQAVGEPVGVEIVVALAREQSVLSRTCEDREFASEKIANELPGCLDPKGACDRSVEAQIENLNASRNSWLRHR